MQKAIVYVDGFNLYYGIKDRGLNHAKWLDLEKFYSNLFEDLEIVKIKYFTSMVIGSHSKLKKQNVYLNALRTFNKIEIIKGEFLETPVEYPRHDNGETVIVTKCTEKQTDVNLACAMLLDALANEPKTEHFILSSVDSDYTFPVKFIATTLNKNVHVVNTQTTTNYSLKNLVKTFITVSNVELEASRLPDKIPAGRGFVCSPKDWR